LPVRRRSKSAASPNQRTARRVDEPIRQPTAQVGIRHPRTNRSNSSNNPARGNFLCPCVVRAARDPQPENGAVSIRWLWG
jgi:hypothetical protein